MESIQQNYDDLVRVLLGDEGTHDLPAEYIYRQVLEALASNITAVRNQARRRHIAFGSYTAEDKEILNMEYADGVVGVSLNSVAEKILAVTENPTNIENKVWYEIEVLAADLLTELATSRYFESLAVEMLKNRNEYQLLVWIHQRQVQIGVARGALEDRNWDSHNVYVQKAVGKILANLSAIDSVLQRAVDLIMVGKNN
jgi:hypothetical protein